MRREHTGRGAAALVLLVVQGLFEAGSILTLVPLLAAVGIPVGEAGWAGTVFDRLGWSPGLLGVLALFVALQTVVAATGLLQARWGLTLQHRVTETVRSRLRDDLDRMKWSSFRALEPGRVLDALTTQTERSGSMVFVALTGASAVVLMVVHAGLAFTLAPVLTVLALGSAALVAFVLSPMIRQARGIGEGLRQRYQEHHAGVARWMAAGRLARFHGSGPFATSKGIEEASVHVVLHRSRARFLFEVAGVLLLAAIAYAAVSVFELEPGRLLLCLYLFARLVPRAQQLQQQALTIQSLRPAWEATSALHREAVAAQEPPAGPVRRLRQRLELRGVTIRHDRTVLDGVDLVVRPGEKVALTGPNGAGKTTLLELLGGLTEPHEGQVLLDGEALDRPAWRQRVAYVPQEPILLDGTVQDNLAWAAPDADEARVTAALAAVDCPRLAPDVEVGPGGNRLSGGERQRLALAMALVRDPDLVLLDEPSSQMDAAAEERLAAVVARLEPAVVMVSHRPGAMAGMPRVLHLDGGRLAPAAAAS
ncbi:MAG: ATP-binding cassette domain-containing protein [Thermoplasmatota archaeon]